MPSETLQLQTADAERYQTLKQSISDGIAICYIVGSAFREIREKQYYLADGYKDFDAFIAGEYGWTRRYCNQLIVDAEAINSLPPSMRKLITSHKAAQELSRVPESLRVVVLDQATKGGTKTATQASIRKSAPKPPPPKPKAEPSPVPTVPAPKSTPPPAPKKEKLPTDATGLEIPKEILPLWERGNEAQELLTYLSALRSKIKKAQEARDPLFVEVDFTDDLANLNKVYTDLSRAKPHAVCPTCQGKLPKDCMACKGRGFVSEFYWMHCVPAEVRAMREAKK